MKKYVLFTLIAFFCLSSHSAWAQYVKVTANNGTVSWIPIAGNINGKNFEINNSWSNAIDINTAGSIDLSQVWSESGGKGTRHQVTSIGDYAFMNCSGLTSIKIPSGVTSIANQVFSGCIGLNSMVVESGNPVYDSRNNCVEGVVVYEGKGDYFIVETLMGYSVLEVYSGILNEGDRVRGELNQYLFKYIINRNRNDEVKVYIEDYMLSDKKALQWLGKHKKLKYRDQEAYDEYINQ